MEESEVERIKAEVLQMIMLLVLIILILNLFLQNSLLSIYYDDIKVVSEAPPLFMINLRPYSKDVGSEDLHVSALLSVRCFPGYPYKCPKLKITSEKDLSKDDADKLLSLLNDQAMFNAREGLERWVELDTQR